MTTPLRLFLAVAGASALAVAAFANTPAPSNNVLVIVIDNGPHAGTYKPPAADTMCMLFKQQKQFTVVYKDFDAADPTKVGEGGINITNPDEAGPKRGDVLVAFGSRGDKQASRYSVSVPGDSAGPITLIRNGKAADLAFQGRTKDGISLHVTARCPVVEEL
jgi:hypothetical protein